MKTLSILLLAGAAIIATAASLNGSTFQAPPPTQSGNDTFPAATWERWARPEDANYSSARLNVLRAWLREGHTKSLFVVVDGKELFSYGDVTAPSKVASVRKSILGILYGKYVGQGAVDLSKTVVQLGLNDVQPFMDVEKAATLRHLMLARSGIYLPSGNEELTSMSPKRGSYAPGTYFQYQNWDFNALGAAFESLTGRNIYEALETDLARPLGMQDFDRSLQKKVDVMPESRFPEYAMRLSSRDMARVGLLMLRRGNWRGTQLVPAAWIKEMTTLVTPVRDLHPAPLNSPAWSRRWGYGTLWWVWEADNVPDSITGPYEGAFTAMGAWGQYITVIPVLDLVVAHNVDFEEAERAKQKVEEVSPPEYDVILQMLIAS